MKQPKQGFIIVWMFSIINMHSFYRQMEFPHDIAFSDMTRIGLLPPYETIIHFAFVCLRLINTL